MCRRREQHTESEVADELVTIGERAKWIAESAAQAGLRTDRITEFDTAEKSIDYIKDHLTPRDVVLVKGSRGMQLDIIVTALETVE